MAPSVEILKFTANDAYRADPSVLDEVMGIVSQAPGVIQLHSGPDVLDPQFGWIIVIWESIEHRRGLATNRVAIHEALSKASTKVEFMDDVTFSADLSDALASPVTEFLSWDLHATTDPEDFHKHRVALTEKFLAASPPGFHAGGWGVTAESERKLWFCVGWESPEAFKAFVTRAAELGDTGAKMREIADPKIGLARLTKYEKK